MCKMVGYSSCNYLRVFRLFTFCRRFSGNLACLNAAIPISTPNRDTILAVWAPPIVLDDDRAFALHILGGAGGLVAKLRLQILARGLPGVSTFSRGVRDALEGDGSVQEINQDAFRAAATLAGANLTVSIRYCRAWLWSCLTVARGLLCFSFYGGRGLLAMASYIYFLWGG